MRLRETIAAARALTLIQMKPDWPDWPGRRPEELRYSTQAHWKLLRTICGRCGGSRSSHRYGPPADRVGLDADGVGHTFVPEWAVLLDVPHRR